MGIIKVPKCFGHEILILNHPWKSRIRPLEQILGWNCYQTYFWCTLYKQQWKDSSTKIPIFAIKSYFQVELPGE